MVQNPDWLAKAQRIFGTIQRDNDNGTPGSSGSSFYWRAL